MYYEDQVKLLMPSTIDDNWSIRPEYQKMIIFSTTEIYEIRQNRPGVLLAWYYPQIVREMEKRMASDGEY